MLLVRDTLTLAFFARRFDAALLEGIQAAFERWLALIPQEKLKFAAVGPTASRLKPVTAKTLGQCRAHINPKTALSKENLFFVIQGEELVNPSHRFEVSCGAASGQEGEPENCMVDMRFPPDTASGDKVQAFLDFALAVAGQMPYDSGYASLQLSWGAESLLHRAAERILPLALRHPGMDVAINSFTTLLLGRKCRGARWLTFLGRDLLEQLGGEQALRARLDPAIECTPVGTGLALRAGSEPLPGDVNRQDTLPLIASVARAIEPVTFFKDKNLRAHLFDENDEKFERWQRRFLSPIA